MRRFVFGCVTAAALLIGAVGASAAHATTVTIGQVADPAQVGPGTGCTNCRGFPRSTDNATPSYAVPAGDWVLTAWSTRAGAEPPELPPIEPLAASRQATGVRMFLVESAGGNNYTLQGQSAEVSIEAEKINTYPAQIPVQSGWRLGLDSGDGHTLVYQTVHADDVTVQYPNETVGTSAPTLGEFPGFLVNVSAKLESDCDSDGLGDDTQDNDLSACTAAPGPGPGPSPGPSPGPAPGPSEAAATCRGIPATIVGTDGANQIAGTTAADVIAALGGNDTVTALGGKDVVCGGPGKDTLRGGKGKDTLLGQAGKDKLKGGGGKDFCKGGKGKDTAAKCEVEKSI